MELKERQGGLPLRAQVDRRRFVCLTNIPAPYRLHFFHALSEELDSLGWKLEVWFMAKSEPDRHWQFAAEDFKFCHRFPWGISLRSSHAFFHINPSVPFLLRAFPPEILLVAGSWVLPTSIMATLNAKVLSSTTLLFWSESHLKSIRKSGGVVDGFRRQILKMYDGFVVSGKLARQYVDHYVPQRPTYTLPNIVDENVFRDRVRRERAAKVQLREEFRIPSHHRVLVLPARLIPEKNLPRFLSAISSLPCDVARSFTLLIAGEGPLREQAECWKERNAEIDVRLLGQVGESEMIKLYAIADAFVLPSMSDPNPLSVIEALWAGLPLILSDRVGNHLEALKAGKNGWIFDAESESAMREAVEQWAVSSDQELALYGEASIKIAEEQFRTEMVVNNFLNQVLPQER
jgi:glycosyltransferase involved in cell wall biosynthesis